MTTGGEGWLGEPDHGEQAEEKNGGEPEKFVGPQHGGLAGQEPFQHASGLVRGEAQTVELVQGLGHRGGVGGEMFFQAHVVQAVPPVPEGGGEGGAEAAGHDAHEIGKPGGVGHLIRMQPGEGDTHQGNEEQGHARPVNNLGQDDGGHVRLAAEAGPQVAHHPQDNKGQGGVDARIHLVHGLAHHRGEEHGEQAHRGGDQPGPGGRIAHLGL